VTTLPRLAFPEQSASLCFIPLHSPDVVRRIGLVKSANRTLAPTSQAMEAFVLEQLWADAV
jgi:DNA-binding transcriptional LysR family regulator